MRKLTILFALLTLSVGMWANTIYYIATDGLGAIKDNAFDLTVQTHSFNESTNTGLISFVGDVTEIKEGAFQGLTALLKIDIPYTIKKIENNAFGGCVNLATVSFEGTACQNDIDGSAFDNVGSSTEPATVLLPEEWKYANAPASSTTPWHGGYFSSTFYSTDEATDKQDAIDEIDLAITGVTDETILTIANKTKEDINAATSPAEFKAAKTLPLAKINALVPIYTARQGIRNAEINKMINEDVNGICEATTTEKITELQFEVMTTIGLVQIGRTEGIEDGRAEALGEMGTPCTDCPAVEVTKGNKTVTLYAPESVDYIEK